MTKCDYCLYDSPICRECRKPDAPERPAGWVHGPTGSVDLKEFHPFDAVHQITDPEGIDALGFVPCVRRAYP